MNKYNLLKIYILISIVLLIPFGINIYSKYQEFNTVIVEVYINDVKFNHTPYIYVNTGNGYNSSEVYKGNVENNKIIYQFSVNNKFKGIRIDPMAKIDQFTLNKINIILNGKANIISFNELANYFELRDMESNIISDGIVLKSLSNDPKLISKDTLPLNLNIQIDLKKILLLYIVIYFFIGILLFKLKSKINGLVNIIKEEHLSFSKIFVYIASSVLIAGYFEIVFILLSNINNTAINYSNINYFYLPRYIFFLIWTLVVLLFLFVDKKYILKYRYAVVMIVFISLIAGNYNLSSFTIYEQYLKERTENYTPNTILWSPKKVRSDEYVVEKPYYYAQINAKDKLEYKNYNLMLNGQDMVVSAFAPVKNIVLLAKPELWGYLFLGADRAFAFYWWFKVLFFIMCTFEFFYYFTKNAKGALIAALILYFSPPTQWWFSQNTINTIPLFFIGVVLFDKFLIERNTIKHYIYFIGLFLCIITFIMIMYPARQVLIGYTAGFFIIYFVYKNRKVITKRHIFSLILLGIITVLFVIQFYYNSSSAIHDILNTTYPGKNRSWGDVTYVYWFTNYFYNFITPYIRPKISNQSELSQYYNFIIPFVFYIAIYIYKKYKIDTYQKILLFAITFFMCIIVISPPDIMRNYMLLKYTYAYRLSSHINFLVMLLLITFLLNKSSGQLLSNMKAIFLSAVSTITLYMIFIYYSVNFEQFTSSPIMLNIFLLSLTVYFIFGYLLLKNTDNAKKYALILLLLLSIGTTLTVNPVNYGSSAIFEKVVTKEIVEYDKKDNMNNNKWIYIGKRMELSILLTYAGLNKVGGIYYYPDLDLNRTIDRNGEHYNALNSFLIMYFNNINNEENVEIKTGIRTCTVTLPLKVLEELGVKYIISDNEINSRLSEKLLLLKYYEKDNLYMYKLVE